MSAGRALAAGLLALALCAGASLGAGAVPAVAYVAIGRSLPELLRARMMAMMSTAWVVPGLVGPLVSAAVAHLFGWRWVFIGLIPLVAVTGALALGGLARLGRPARSPDAEHRIADAVATAAGAAVIIAGLTLGNPLAAAVTSLAGAALLLPALVRLLALAVAFPLAALVASPAVALLIHRAGLEHHAAHYRLLARAIDAVWRRTADGPLRLVGSDTNLVNGVAFYLADRPSTDDIMGPTQTPWASPGRIARDGIALVCAADDAPCIASADAIACRR